MTKSRFLNSCRLCNNLDLLQIINFGNVALGNNLQNNKKDSLSCKAYPLKLVRCDECKHFQLNYSVSEKNLYATNYTYLSGIAPSFTQHFAKYADWIVKKCNLKKTDLVLDIGSNDGTCLNEFKRNNINVLGIDPAKLPSQIANKNRIDTINKFFNKSSAKKIKKKYGKVDFITSHNVLAHIPNLNETFENISFLLKEGGYFCFEIGYFLEVLKNNYFDTIYHEHLDYHHAAPLVKYLNNIGFSIININTNKIQGGTLRILCKKDLKKNILPQSKKFIKSEKNSILNNINYLKNWPVEIRNNNDKFRDIIEDLSKKNKSIIGYGAPTKATLLLKLANFKSGTIKNIIEDNSLKINKFVPKTDIKIVKYDKEIINSIDVIVIFAWNFFSDIMIKLKKDNIKNKIIILPLPKVKMYYL